MAYAPPKTGKHLRMGMRIKPGYPVKDGLILYCAESRHGHGDFTSLAVKDSHLEFRFSVGSSAYRNITDWFQWKVDCNCVEIFVLQVRLSSEATNH